MCKSQMFLGGKDTQSLWRTVETEVQSIFLVRNYLGQGIPNS